MGLRVEVCGADHADATVGARFRVEGGGLRVKGRALHDVTKQVMNPVGQKGSGYRVRVKVSRYKM